MDSVQDIRILRNYRQELMAQEKVTEEALRQEADFWHEEYRKAWESGQYWEFDVRKRNPEYMKPRFSPPQSPLTKYRTYVFQHAISKREMRVIELGCGGGGQTLEFARAGCHVTGIDLSEANLDIARQRALDQLEEWDELEQEVYGVQLDRKRYIPPKYVAMDLNDPDLSHPELIPGSVDLIFSGGTLHHIVNGENLMRAARDLLVPGGSLMILDSRGHDPKIQALIDLTRKIRGVTFPESPFEGQHHDYHTLVSGYYDIVKEDYFSIFEFRILPHLAKIHGKFPNSLLAHIFTDLLHGFSRSIDWTLIKSRIAKSEMVFIHGVKTK